MNNARTHQSATIKTNERNIDGPIDSRCYKIINSLINRCKRRCYYSAFRPFRLVGKLLIFTCLGRCAERRAISAPRRYRAKLLSSPNSRSLPCANSLAQTFSFLTSPRAHAAEKTSAFKQRRGKKTTQKMRNSIVYKLLFTLH